MPSLPEVFDNLVQKQAFEHLVSVKQDLMVNTGEPNQSQVSSVENG